jgi:tetratricopeptide (TPR) repeat protein
LEIQVTDIQPYIDQIIKAINQAGAAISDNLKSQIKTPEDMYIEAKQALTDQDYVKAEQIFKILIQNEKHPQCYNFMFSYAYLLLQNCRYIEAIDMLTRGSRINNNVPEFYTNIGYALSRMHKQKESIPYYKKAVDIMPDHYKSWFDWGLVELRLGNFKDGWRLHENRNLRTEPEKFSDRYVKGRLPLWDGNPESIKGARIFVSKEQGFGDGLQFFRYLEPLSKVASHVTYGCEQALEKLFKNSNTCENVTITSDYENIDPSKYDFWLYQMSIPYALGVETGWGSPPAYLEAADCDVPQLPAGFKVGLAWRGNPRHINDKNRSLTLSMFDHFPKDITYVSLQANIIDKGEVARSKLNIIDVTPKLIDFNDTAKFLDQLDLIISIDSAPIHLAGALGKTCWVYVPYDGSDWRWGEYGTQSGLYNDITTYWQDRMHNYDVLDRMAEDLQKLIDKK